MKGVLAAVLMLTGTSLFAQFPPARDLRDAVRLLQETQRQIEPAIAAVRDEAALLNTLAKAEKQLKDAQPMSSFDEAGKVINEFADRRAGIDPPLSRELRKTIEDARQILAATRPMMNAGAARERLHHEIVHPLQQKVIRSAGELQQLAQQFQFMQQRAVSQVLPEALNAVGYAATDLP
ncbi:MAG TPA: hypothetical protein VLV78_07325 [Thermoanaerobaculia bacterium]|nr:hypothetical protein [Thermoanaerobaculia bacterium]